MNVKDGYGNIYKISDIVEKTIDLSSLQGKYCLAIGDSYTFALAGANGELTKFNQSIGMAGTLNHGIVSSTIRDRDMKAEHAGYAYKPIVCRVCNIGSLDTSGQTVVGDYVPLDRKDIGYIWFMGGTNDSMTWPTSTGTDPADSYRGHISGAVNLIMQKLTESYPGVPIIVGLQPCYANQDPATVQVSDFTSDHSNLHFSDVTGLSQRVLSCIVAQRKQKIVRETVKIYANAYDNVSIVDFCFDWYSPLIDSEYTKYWTSSDSGLHLTGDGYREIVQGTKYNSIKSALEEIYTVS